MTVYVAAAARTGRKLDEIKYEITRPVRHILSMAYTYC